MPRTIKKHKYLMKLVSFFNGIIVLSMLSCATAKELTIVVQNTNQGPSINAQILSRYMQKHDPEITSVAFKIVPGAGGIVSANYMYEVAPRDGWTIAVISWSALLQSPNSNNNVRFNTSKFTWIGSTSDGRNDSMLLVANRDIDTNKPLVIGFDSPESVAPMRFISAALGGNARSVTGYKNKNEVKLAFENGEIDATVNSYAGIRVLKPEWLSSNKIRILLQFGNGSTRNSRISDVPTISELLSDPDELDLLKILELQYIMLRPFIAPPGIPADRARKLRVSFNDAVNDPGYVAEAAAIGLDVRLITHGEAEHIIDQINSSPRNLLDQLR